MLYPKEDRMTNKLMFACRTCQFSEEAISSCVFRNNLYNTVGETAGVTQDVGSDPTVSGRLFDSSDLSFTSPSLDDDLFRCCLICGMEVVGDEEQNDEYEGNKDEEERDVNNVIMLNPWEMVEQEEEEEQDEEEKRDEDEKEEGEKKANKSNSTQLARGRVMTDYTHLLSCKKENGRR